ncbi:MAG: hypothetical protein LBE08_01980 [Bifidobacteriaceae bacterium]|jgi:hypothetical protein|nr:hypothetical protein [Bifidobacteriaceae bacterium]
MDETALISTIASLNALVTVLALATTSWLHLTQLSLNRTRDKIRRRELINSACERLDGRTTLEDLSTAWDSLLASYTGVAATTHRPADAMSYEALFFTSEDQQRLEKRNKLVKAARDHANVVNLGLCEMIDAGLVSPRDFILVRPEMHECLLNELSLVAPALWYQSLAEKLGRWGYRVLLLYDILWNLRSESTRDEVRQWLPPSICGVEFCEHSSPVTVERRSHRLTIDRRGKVTQNEEAEAMKRFLNGLGLTIEDPEAVLKATKNQKLSW